eukprot:Clim_evm7s33 gene=Clim_evmTU7s33
MLSFGDEDDEDEELGQVSLARGNKSKKQKVDYPAPGPTPTLLDVLRVKNSKQDEDTLSDLSLKPMNTINDKDVGSDVGTSDIAEVKDADRIMEIHQGHPKPKSSRLAREAPLGKDRSTESSLEQLNRLKGKKFAWAKDGVHFHKSAEDDRAAEEDEQLEVIDPLLDSDQQRKNYSDGKEIHEQQKRKKGSS